MAQHTGVVTVKLDGQSLGSKEGAKLDFGGYERTPIMADGQIVGFTEKPVNATITCTVAHSSATDVSLINNARDVTLLFECDSGHTYMVRNAYSAKPPSLTGGEGDLECEFQGKPAEEI